jgi:prepilin signal peptidase PulO-like enzyme (type II secretory pathway)
MFGNGSVRLWTLLFVAMIGILATAGGVLRSNRRLSLMAPYACRDRTSMGYLSALALVGGCVDAVLYTLSHTACQFVGQALLWAVLLTCLNTDVQEWTVLDEVTIPGALCVAEWDLATGVNSAEFIVSGMLIGAALILVIYFSTRGKIGLGDAKLFLSIGAMLGPAGDVGVLVLASTFGVLLFSPSFFSRSGRDDSMPIPFVPLLSAACLAWQLYGGDLVSWYGGLVQV